MQDAGCMIEPPFMLQDQRNVCTKRCSPSLMNQVPTNGCDVCDGPTSYVRPTSYSSGISGSLTRYLTHRDIVLKTFPKRASESIVSSSALLGVGQTATLTHSLSRVTQSVGLLGVVEARTSHCVSVSAVVGRVV